MKREKMMGKKAICLILCWWSGYCGLALTTPVLAGTSSEQKYWAQPGPFEVRTVEQLVLADTHRNKNLELRVQYPVLAKTVSEMGRATGAELGRLPLIIFSHGAGGSKDGALPLTRHWVTHGYVTIQPTHEDSVILRRRRGEDYWLLDAVEIAWSDSQAWLNRAHDISFVLDSLVEIEERVKAIQGRIDRKHIGMSGHSFGAMTTMYVAGAKITLPGEAKAHVVGDERILAFLALSPQGPGRMGFTEDSWSDVRRPVMLVTGSKDRGGKPTFTPQWRLIPFEKFPPGDKYALWIEGANHMTFGCDAQRAAAGLQRLFNQATTEQIEQQERFIEFVKIGSSAYWDAYIKGDPNAKSYLCSKTLEHYSRGLVKLKKK
jgi:predicted dienelactone hydrolase